MIERVVDLFPFEGGGGVVHRCLELLEVAEKRQGVIAGFELLLVPLIHPEAALADVLGEFFLKTTDVDRLGIVFSILGFFDQVELAFFELGDFRGMFSDP